MDKQKLVQVGFAAQQAEPNDREVCDMIDKAIYQALGNAGLNSIIKKGDKVVIKVNVLGSDIGSYGDKGRGCNTDARITRYVAEKIREIIGTEGTADLKVIDTVFYPEANPSSKYNSKSFYWARLERTGDNSVDEGDVCYDANADGYLDGTSMAKLVNLEDPNLHRKTYSVKVKDSNDIIVSFPCFLRTKEEAEKSGLYPDEYCDIFIGLPIFKSHGLAGMTGAIKLHYGIRHGNYIDGDSGRLGHNGLYIDETGVHNKEGLYQYLCAQHLIRSYDFVIMDCLTGNRQGPLNNTGRIGENYFSDSPVDYIVTNAIMASKDSVAIDTVEAVLGGYDPRSIGLLEKAYENGLGTMDPSYIRVGESNDFFKHRQYLCNIYKDGKYPFPDGFGGARVANRQNLGYEVNCIGVKKISESKYVIGYKINRVNSKGTPVVRAELRINGSLIDYKLIKSGEDFISNTNMFILDIEKYNYPKGYIIDIAVIIYDRLFNSKESNEYLLKV